MEFTHKRCGFVTCLLITFSRRGFGFVTFDSEAAVEHAVSNQGGHTIDRKTVEVKKAVPRDSDSGENKGGEKGTKMFIGGLLKSTTEETVKTYFEKKFNCTVDSVELIYEKRDQIAPGQEPRPRLLFWIFCDASCLCCHGRGGGGVDSRFLSIFEFTNWPFSRAILLKNCSKKVTK